MWRATNLTQLEAGENFKQENDEEARKKKMTRLVMMQEAEDVNSLFILRCFEVHSSGSTNDTAKAAKRNGRTRC